MNARLPAIFLVGFAAGLFAGCLGAGFYMSRVKSGELTANDRAYSQKLHEARETIDRLEHAAAGQRAIISGLEANFARAKALSGELSAAAAQNVSNLREAIDLVARIREKVKILAAFYAAR